MLSQLTQICKQTLKRLNWIWSGQIQIQLCVIPFMATAQAVGQNGDLPLHTPCQNTDTPVGSRLSSAKLPGFSRTDLILAAQCTPDHVSHARETFS